jgi:hypothetical protein
MDHLYGFTVNGIQAYIFQTNNLKEIIGASEIVEKVCTEWFKDFIDKNGIKGTAIQMAAGNIKFLTSKDDAQTIFKEFGACVNKKAPGLPFSQAVVERLDLKGLDRALSAQRNLPLHDMDLGHMGRFLARTTGDMAVDMSQVTNSNYLEKRRSIDRSNLAKFKNSSDADDTLRKKAGIVNRTALVEDFEDMAADGKHNWLALIHIDGNGMGKEIRRIVQTTKDEQQRSDKIKEFAKKIATCTNEAFRKAYEKTFESFTGTKIPFRPLILGGDDVTVILRADYALRFVETFLEKYENQSEAELGKKMKACAGIAFIKAKFPFHYTADLAEELCGAAKKACNREKSGVVFHKVSDSFISDYEELVSKELTLPDNTKLSKGFYELQEIEGLLKKVEVLKKGKGLKNAMRQWVDLSMNKSPEATLIEKRAKKKYSAEFSNYPKNQYADFLTLLAVS